MRINKDFSNINSENLQKYIDFCKENCPFFQEFVNLFQVDLENLSSFKMFVQLVLEKSTDYYDSACRSLIEYKQACDFFDLYEHKIEDYVNKKYNNIDFFLEEEGFSDIFQTSKFYEQNGMTLKPKKHIWVEWLLTECAKPLFESSKK